MVVVVMVVVVMVVVVMVVVVMIKIMGEIRRCITIMLDCLLANRRYYSL